MFTLGMVSTNLFMLFYMGDTELAGNGKVFFLTSG